MLSNLPGYPCMINKPLVSIVIATYNMAQFLPFAVRSVLAQTYDNIEVIIVDDGSTDHTSEVAQPFLADARVQYHCQVNQGQAAAKNRGIKESHGDFIAFLDADDMWFPEKLELQIPLFLRSETLGVVYARLQCIDELGKELPDLSDAHYMLYRGRVTDRLLLANFIRFGTSVVRRECFERFGGFKEDLRMGIDYDLWLRFSTQYEFDYVDRPLLLYRIWQGQMSVNCKGRYENGLEIMRQFKRDFPGVVDQKSENLAWAATYLGLGECLLTTEKHVLPAIACYLRALSYKPSHWPAWRLIVEAILGIRRRPFPR